VERLQACRVGEVGVVGVGLERDVGVCCVCAGQVGGEVVEAAVVRFADERDAAEELFSGLGGVVGCFVDVAEAEFALSVSVAVWAWLMRVWTTYNVLQDGAHVLTDGFRV
jgi:hypothetical protein